MPEDLSDTLLDDMVAIYSGPTVSNYALNKNHAQVSKYKKPLLSRTFYTEL